MLWRKVGPGRHACQPSSRAKFFVSHANGFPRFIKNIYINFHGCIAIKLKIKERQIEIDIFIVWKCLFSIENIPKLYLLANFAKMCIFPKR